jgi:16S rRNA (adenine1518-N6/adenine1519-N6)-dimethyltransferase
VTARGKVRAKKSLGQHFLTDLAVARRIVEALSPGNAMLPNDALLSGDALSPGEVLSPGGVGDVLEVGCGMGALTQFLLERNDLTLHGVEVDRESVAYLREHFPQFAPRLVVGDFLRIDLPAMFPRGFRVIGNFPYNISSQILFRVIACRDLAPEVVGMVQREVALRIAGREGSRDYGIMSVLLQAWYDVEYLFTVGEGAFDPPPKVKSAVIRLRRNGVKRLDCDEELFVRVVKAAFGQRRKMLRNALRAVFGDFGGEEHPFFTMRAEALSVSLFVELTNWVESRLRMAQANQLNRSEPVID